MKQNIMMRRMLSRLLVTFFFLPSFVTLSAQTGGTQPQVLSSVLKTLPADKFEFNRQLKDFSVVGSTLHCYLSMPRSEWTDMLATVSSEYTVDDFSSMYDQQRSATLARLSNEKICADSSFIYLQKGYDALAWGNLLWQCPQVKAYMKEQGLSIKCHVLDDKTNAALCTYDITLHDIDVVDSVKVRYSLLAAKVLYMRCYSTLIGMLITDSVMPLSLDVYTTAESVTLQGKQIVYTYQLADTLFSRPGFKEQLEKQVKGHVARNDTRYLKYLDYHLRNVYHSADNTHSFSIYVF